MVQFAIGQKAAARALLDFHFPSQELVAAAVGTTRQTMTAWVKTPWSYADRRLAGAAEAQERHRIRMLKSYGRNVPAAIKRTDLLQFHDDIAAHDALVELADMSGADGAAETLFNADGEPMSLTEALQTALKRLSTQLAHRINVEGKLLGREQIDSVTALMRLAERMETVIGAEERQARLARSETLTATLLRIDKRIHELAREYASDYLRDMIAERQLVPAPGLEDEEEGAGA